MKWNWGYSLTLVFIAFASHIGYLVYKCTQEKFDLVSEDYYAAEIHYQNQIDGAANAKQISAVAITQTGDDLRICFPKELKGETCSGSVWWYCPANAGNDRKMSLALDQNGVMNISKKRLAAAVYTAKISWQAGETSYYFEQPVTITK